MIAPEEIVPVEALTPPPSIYISNPNLNPIPI